MKRIAVFLLLTAFVASCDDRIEPVAPDEGPPLAKQNAIVDGAHNDGNEFFYFLPPLVPNPHPAGDFNPELSPRVEICVVTMGECDPYADLIETFTNTTGPGSETIRVAGGKYIVNWHTGDYDLDSEITYRISVHAGETLFGFADVDLVDKGNELKGVDGEEFVGLKNGSTLPIKFRIEHGALCEGGAEGCTEQKIDQGGGTVPISGDESTPDEPVAAIYFPEGALPDSIEEVNVIAEFIPNDEIDDLNPDIEFEKYPFAVNISTEPPVELEEEVVFTLCQDPSIDDPLSPNYLPDEFHDQLRVLRDDGESVQILDPAPPGTVPVTDCAVYEPEPVSGPGGIASLVGGVKRFAGRVLGMAGPQPLAANMYLHGGLTCMMPFFSDVYAVLPTENLVAHWPGDGNFDDIIGTNDGDTVGYVSFAAGVEGQAFDFDGSGGVVGVGPAPGIDELQELTVSGWVRMNDSGRQGKMQRFVTLGNSKAVIRQDGVAGWAQFHFYMSIDGDLRHVRANNALNTQCFHHVAGTYDGTTLRAYLDGEEVGFLDYTGTVDDGWGVEFSSMSPQAPGGVEDPLGEALDGRLDEVLIYDRALTGTEIEAMYHNDSPARCQPASGATSTFSVADSEIVVGDTTIITLQAKDALGNDILAGGSSVTFLPMHGAVTGYVDMGPVIDHGDGTYTAWVVGVGTGMPVTIRATVDGEDVTTGDPWVVVILGDLSAEDVEGMLASAYYQWWRANHHYNGIAPMLSVIADEHTSSWGNFGMRYTSIEPREAYDNTAEAPYSYATLYPWLRLHLSLMGIRDAMIAVDGGLDLGADGPMTMAFAKFLQGLSLGTLALVYDQAFILDEDFDFMLFELYPYGDVMSAAEAKLDEATSLAQANTFTTSSAWMNGTTITNAEMVALANSYKARFLASVGRTPVERASANWTQIAGLAAGGISSDFSIMSDGSFLDGLKTYASGGAGVDYNFGTWGRLDVRYIGPADTAGHYQWWLDQPVADRNEIFISTPDRRVTGADSMSDGLYVKHIGPSPFPASRGTYHFSLYGDKRYDSFVDDWYADIPTPAVDISVAEMDFLQAEAMYRTGNSAGALAYVNQTRVNNGLLPAITVTGPTGPGCVPRVPDAFGDLQCGDLWEALKYEKRMEVYHTGLGIAYFDDRGWDDLVENTFRHLPIPGQELEILMMPYYTFGGDPGTWPDRVAGAVTMAPEALEAYFRNLGIRLEALEAGLEAGGTPITR
ncbi:LamG-like jellyroll fold domain-containing protein [Gemmatimonadota bacterium]